MQQRRTRSGQSGVRRGAAAAQITEVLGSSVGDAEPQSSPAHWDAEDAGVASSRTVAEPWSVRYEFLNQPRCAEGWFHSAKVGLHSSCRLLVTECDEGGRLRGVPERCLIDAARDSVQLRAR